MWRQNFKHEKPDKAVTFSLNGTEVKKTSCGLNWYIINQEGYYLHPNGNFYMINYGFWDSEKEAKEFLDSLFEEKENSVEKYLFNLLKVIYNSDSSILLWVEDKDEMKKWFDYYKFNLKQTALNKLTKQEKDVLGIK